jgi:hypothetical protein
MGFLLAMTAAIVSGRIRLEMLRLFGGAAPNRNLERIAPV